MSNGRHRHDNRFICRVECKDTLSTHMKNGRSLLHFIKLQIVPKDLIKYNRLIVHKDKDEIEQNVSDSCHPVYLFEITLHRKVDLT